MSDGFYEALGMNIKVARVRKRMRQCDLARAVGVGVATICRWESGVRHIPVQDLLKVCQALDQQIGDILPEIGDYDA